MPSAATEPFDPLPRQHLLPPPTLRGAIKRRPEDFLVDEIPLYEPSGEGEHLYLGIEKRGIAHAEMTDILCRHFGVQPDAIGFAGMKDKVAITRQTVSLHLLRDPPALNLPDDRVHILWARRHGNKLRRGHLAGNRFVIRIRDIDPLAVPQVHRRLIELERTGVPDYYGSQRFGYRHNNHRLAALLIQEDWTGLLDELLGSRGSWFPPYQLDRRQRYDSGDFKGALEQWSRSDRAESAALRALRQGRNPRGAVMSIGKHGLTFWVSALQSAIFNRVLDRRLEDQRLTTIVEGDLAWLHHSRRVFLVTPEDLAREDLAHRARTFEISPSGPLWGQNMTRTAGSVDEAEVEALASTGLAPELFSHPRRGLLGGRRPLRSQITHTQIDSGLDEFGPYVRVAFDLPRGVYATIVMRELVDLDAQDQASDTEVEASGD